jgi:hypothetical protein
MKQLYVQFYARIVLVIGGALFFLQTLAKKTFGFGPVIQNILAVLVSVAVGLCMFDRDFYLPFLGQCVFPSSTQGVRRNLSLKENVTVTLRNLPPSTSVVYWAANESTSIFDDPALAYSSYTNSGVGMTNANGEITFQIACPGRYNVKKFGLYNKTLERHVHYRYELPASKGLFSKVFTENVDC